MASRLHKSESIGHGKPMWSNTFPEEFETLSDSEKFMERCFLLGISQLLQSRKLLPENVFKKRSISDICRCWVPDTKCLTGGRVVEKIKGAADAMRQGYLKELIVVVSTNEDDYNDAIEVFTWSVDYSSTNQAIATFSTGVNQALAKLEYTGPESVKSQTIQLLLRIRKLCREVLQPLADGAFPTFRITYTDRTPKGYQAPGFYRCYPELYNLDPKARSMMVSGTATAHHKVLLSLSSIYLDDEFAGSERLNTSCGNASVFNSSFSSVENLYDTIEDTVTTPRITLGEHIQSKKRTTRGSKPERTTKRKMANEVEPIREVTPTEPLEALSLQLTPGKSMKLDRLSPNKE